MNFYFPEFQTINWTVEANLTLHIVVLQTFLKKTLNLHSIENKAKQ